MTRIPDSIYTRLPKRMPDELKFSNYALNFGGLGYVQVPHAASITFTSGDFTILSWGKLTYGVSDTIICKGRYQIDGWYLIQRATNALGFVVNQALASQETQTGANVFVDGKYFYYAIVRSGVKVYIYINGVDKTVFQPAITDPVASARVLYIGRYDLAGQEITGLVDEVRILPIALSAAQVWESLVRGYARRELDARLILRMEENSGLTVYDESGYGNNGSLLPALTPPTWVPVSKHELLAEARV